MLKATVAGATDFGINDEKYESRTFVFDPTEKKSFALLQEAFIYYNNGNHTALVGREELTTPMIDADDWYMLADSFELARYKNTSLENTTFHLGYFAKMESVLPQVRQNIPTVTGRVPHSAHEAGTRTSQTV
jgi:hypothetical protein